MKKFFTLIGVFFCAVIYSPAQNTDSFKVSNTVLYYTVQGKGDPVLLLSGGPGFASESLSLLAQELSKNYTAILFDQRGTGKSINGPIDTSTINLRQAVADINILREKLELKKISIIGHSWGAMLGMSYAAQYSDAVEKLILMGPGPLDLPGFMILQDMIMSRASKEERIFMAAAMDSMTRFKPSEELIKKYNKVFFRLFIYDALKVDSLNEELKAPMNNQMNELMVGSLMRTGYNLKPAISKFDIPVLIITGRQDPVGLFPSFHIKELNKKAELKWIEKSGHFPWAEAPQSFYNALLSFLARGH